jgi:chloramphenicol-sensitive protein RarD
MKPQTEHGIGFAAALGAFGIWGFLPLYFYLIGPRVNAWEVLAHRIIWATLILAAYALISGRLGRLVDVFRQRNLWLPLSASALFIGTNWIVFIWAVTHDHVLETSLGYYITPLLNVLMGMLFLGERQRPLQWLAVALAVVGVSVSVGEYGQIPWVALTLATAFALYGLVRKQVPVDSATGLLAETSMMIPVSIFLLIWMGMRNELVFLQAPLSLELLLVGQGFLTIAPLLLFAVGARRLRLGTIGLLNYIAPSLQFLSAVFLLGEPFTHVEAITFACIWTALVLYSIDALSRRPVAKLAEVSDE